MHKATLTVAGVVLAILVFASHRQADALGIELEGRYWVPDINGTASLADFDLPPDFDVSGLLGLEADGVPEGRFTFRIFLGFYIRATYQKMDNSGERNVQDLIGLPIPIAGSVRSNLDFDYGRLALGWRFVFPEKIFSIGAFAEAKGFSGDAGASVSSPFFTDSISESFEAVLPSIGATVEISPSEKWQIFGEASFEAGYDEADMVDWEIGLRYYPVGVLGLGAGYRAMDLDGTIDNVLLNVDWKGFFVSGLLRF